MIVNAKELKKVFDWHRENGAPVDPAYIEVAKALLVPIDGLMFEMDTPRPASDSSGLYADLG